jgi:hypothetical protein
MASFYIEVIVSELSRARFLVGANLTPLHGRGWLKNHWRRTVMIKCSATSKRAVAMVRWSGLALGLGALGCAEAASVEAPEWETSVNDLKRATGGWAQEYFLVRPDYRKCAAPMCGGHFAKAVNRHRTRCADGTFARECYVSELKYEGTLPSADHVLVQGSIESNAFPDFGDLGTLVIAGTWGSATANEPKGAFFRVSNSGIVCITTPCPTVQLERLNTPGKRTVSEINLKAADATDEQIEAANAAFAAGDLIVSGRVRKGDPAIGPTLVGTQFFLSDVSVSCEFDADCAENEWCRQTEAGGRACVSFAQQGESCNGFTLPWYYEQCAPDLVCDVPDYVADAPGVCRVPCEDNSGCSDQQYCASGVCRDDGTCENAIDCQSPGNEWPHILCEGHPTCPVFGDGEQCGWDCGAPQCIDVRGVDFGPCDAVLGYGVYFGHCVALSGCDARGLQLFATQEECQALCEQ